jgi:hypothetical protein
MIQGDPTVQHRDFALSFWPEPDVSYLLATELRIGTGTGKLPFDEGDLFYSYDPLVRVTHLEWLLSYTQADLDALAERNLEYYGSANPVDWRGFSVYFRSATMDPVASGSSFYTVDVVSLLQRDYDPASGSGVNFNTGVIVPQHIIVEPAAAVPLPGAALLGIVGLGYAGWRLRRETD